MFLCYHVAKKNLAGTPRHFDLSTRRGATGWGLDTNDRGEKEGGSGGDINVRYRDVIG